MDKRLKGIEYPGITVCMFPHDGKGNVLLNKRSVNCRDEHGRWDICGGSVDLGDTIEETIRKELAEEYLAEPLEIEFLGYRDVHRTNEKGEKTHWIGLDFKVRIDPAKAGNGEPHKFDEMRWFPISGFPASPSPLHSQLPFYFERYRDKLTA
jgi:8-oxo-dGTP diphosphatase